MPTANSFLNLQGIFKEVYGDRKRPMEQLLSACKVNKLIKHLKNRHPKRTR